MDQDTDDDDVIDEHDDDHAGLLAAAAFVYALVRMVRTGFVLHTMLTWDMTPTVMKWALVWEFVFIALMVMAGAALLWRAGRGFILLVSFLACMDMPLGTVFGVLAILVLTRPGMAEAFDRRTPPQVTGPSRRLRLRRRRRQRTAEARTGGKDDSESPMPGTVLPPIG